MPEGLGGPKAMTQADWHLVIQIFIAIGTVGVCILAIWGERIRSYVSGPRLQLRIHDARGDLTWRKSGTQTIYYHVKTENNPHRAPARNVRIFCTSIGKKRADGSFVLEPLAFPVQLTWPFRKGGEPPTIVKDDICDFGYLDQGAPEFKASLYNYPNNFRGFVKAGETMRFGLIAKADNFTSTQPCILEVSWDGEWHADLEEMQKHLVVREL